VSFILRFDPSGQVLLESAAANVATSIFHRLRSNDDYHLVLTGGSSGIQFSKDLGLEISRRVTHGEDRGYDLAGKKLHIWFSDERYVEFDDENRNDSAVLEALNDSELTVVAHRVLPPSEGSVKKVSEAYEEELQSVLGDTAFDFTILGFGNDGHLASCFPGEEKVLNSTKLALPIENSPKPPAKRTTITLSRLGKSRSIVIFAIGENKKDALIETLDGTGNMPAEVLATFFVTGEPMIFTDLFLKDKNYLTSTGEMR